MVDTARAIEQQTERQIAHWQQAAERLKLDDLASPQAWGGLERYLGVALREHLGGVISRLQRQAEALGAMQRAALSPTAQAEVRRKLLDFRRQYLRTETTLDFFADAINTRTNPEMAALLRACDTLAYRSMAQVLDQLGKTTPVVLTYVDKGLGASILKAGLRLWDGGEASPAAAVKIVRHNLLRPTALIHEAGHQVAHITGWNDELARALADELHGTAPELAELWAGWSSELAADAFAFAHTGYASVTALHDVLAGDATTVFKHEPGDPHPISYLRVLLAVEMCRYFFGPGPWDALADSWLEVNSAERAPKETWRLITASRTVLGAVVKVALDQPMRAFNSRSLRELVPPERVSPTALTAIASRIGPALFTSSHWLWTEPLRILALTGLQLSAMPSTFSSSLQRQADSMSRLGEASHPA